jgi:hypothetical protein
LREERDLPASLGAGGTLSVGFVGDHLGFGGHGKFLL